LKDINYDSNRFNCAGVALIAEIVEGLESALEQMQLIAEDLGESALNR
jgi:hypothetical protein